VYKALARVVEKLPPPRSNHGKALSNLVTNLARVHALCAKEMQEEQEEEKYTKSENLQVSVIIICVYLRYIFVLYSLIVSLNVMTEAEMSVPYDPRGCFLPDGAMQFSVCAHCGHPDINWARQRAVQGGGSQVQPGGEDHEEG